MKHNIYFILLYFGVIITAVGAEFRFTLRDSADFGSGSVIQSSYFPGGLKDIGVLAGHANLLSRKDRILLRFDISDFYLSDTLPHIESARLEFTLWYVASPEIERSLQVEHMNYEAPDWSADDLSHPEVTPIGSAPIVLKNHPPQDDEGHYSFDVTESLRQDQDNLRQYAGFRLIDEAETGNSTGGALGYIIQTPNRGRGSNPTLIVTTREP